MTRMFRSTSQPYYARKADVVGKLSNTQFDELYFLLYGDEADGKIYGPAQIFLDERDPDAPGNKYNTYYNFNKEGNTYIAYDYEDGGNSFIFQSVYGMVKLNFYEDMETISIITVKNSEGRLYQNFISIEAEENWGNYKLYFQYNVPFHQDSTEVLADLTNSGFSYGCSGYVNITTTGDANKGMWPVIRVENDTDYKGAMLIHYIAKNTEEATISVMLKANTIQVVSNPFNI